MAASSKSKRARVSILRSNTRKVWHFDKGYASAYFVTDPAKMELLSKSPISHHRPKNQLGQRLSSRLGKKYQDQQELRHYSRRHRWEALATLVVNKMRGSFNVLPSKLLLSVIAQRPCSNIAILTGGSVVSTDTGRKLDSVVIEDLGRADRVWSDKDNTRIVGGKG